LVVWGLSKDKVSWITCPECGSKIGIVITVGKAEAKVEERLPTLGEGWPPGSAQQVLEAAGIDVSQLDVVEDEAMVTITPKRFLGDLWGPINDKVRAMGGVWIRDGKNSRWEIPKQQK